MVASIASDLYYAVVVPIMSLWGLSGFWMTIVIMGTLFLFIGYRTWVSLLFTPIVSFLVSEIEVPDHDWAIVIYFQKAVLSFYSTLVITVLLYLVDKAVRKHNRKKYRQRLRRRRRNRAQRQIASTFFSE